MPLTRQRLIAINVGSILAFAVCMGLGVLGVVTGVPIDGSYWGTVLVGIVAETVIVLISICAIASLDLFGPEVV